MYLCYTDDCDFVKDIQRFKMHLSQDSGSAPSSRGQSEDGSRPRHLPDSINKELEKRRIGKR